jgi:hypothetical protein
MRKVVVLFMAVVVGAAVLVPAAGAGPSRSRMTIPALTPAAPDALTDALEDGDLSPAQYALRRAQSVSHLGAVRQEFGNVEASDPHATTMILRDLALRVGSLDGDERSEAGALLARPNQGGPNDGTLEYDRAEAMPIDTANFRIHYVTGGQHASTLTYATQISTIMEEVWTKEVTQLGWKAPKSDVSATPNGGSEKFDVYLGNTGTDGIYGYCATDVPQSTTDQHSYCVLDNDFSQGQFPGQVFGLNAARVTAAHEFNHAIQFTYDVTDDMWMLEATATWMEDQVYDDVPSSTYNDSYQYLASSSLATPNTSADTWDFFTGFHYGQFIWMRYIHERFGNPDIIRSIFEKTAEPGFYSTKSIETVLGAQTPAADFASSFAEFAAWNTSPRTFYEEGANYETEVVPVRTTRHTVTGTAPFGGTFSKNVDHLTSRSIGFRPGPTVAPGDQITLSVDLGTALMNRAKVVILSGTTQDIRDIPLTSGQGHLTVPFGDKTEVVLVMANGSNVMANCNPDGAQPGDNSCGGNPVDDNETFKYAGVIGTTPAEPGSGSVGAGPSITNFKAAPNPFTPNGDGRKDKTKISFNLGDPASVSMDYMRGSKNLGQFVPPLDLDARPGYFAKWNGKIGNKKAPAGIYTFKLIAVGDSGTTTKTTKVTLRR